ncbi:MAG: hypothetical protein IM613_12755 [Cytophagales bacterium]|nr:hypothetical protein [Cytophagales bacterium]
MKNQQQEQKKGSLTPWLLGASALGLGGIGLALASKGKTGSVKNLLDLEKKKQIVKTGVNDAKNLIQNLQNKPIVVQEEVVQVIKKPGASGYKNIPVSERQAIIQRRRLVLNKAAADENAKTIGADWRNIVTDINEKKADGSYKYNPLDKANKKGKPGASNRKNKRIVENLVAAGDYSRNIYFLCDL